MELNMKSQMFYVKKDKLKLPKGMNVPYFYNFYYSSLVKTKVFTKRVNNPIINGKEICKGYSDYPFIVQKLHKIN